jgi:hypothetical protein
MALTGFTGAYDPSNWTLTNPDGDIDLTNAASGQIDLIGSDTGSTLPANTDWTISITPARAGSLSFDWSYGTLDTGSDDTAGYLLNGFFTELASVDGETSNSPVTFVLNPGDTFGFRVATLTNSGGPGIFTVSNFNVQPVPFEFSPAVGLGILGLNVLYRQRRKQQIRTLK